VVENIQAVNVTVSKEQMMTLDAMSKDAVGDQYSETFMSNGSAIEYQQ
jgi:hypothetical protein